MDCCGLTTEQQPVDKCLAGLSPAFIPLIFRFYVPPIGTMTESSHFCTTLLYPVKAVVRTAALIL